MAQYTVFQVCFLSMRSFRSQHAPHTPVIVLAGQQAFAKRAGSVLIAVGHYAVPPSRFRWATATTLGERAFREIDRHQGRRRSGKVKLRVGEAEVPVCIDDDAGRHRSCSPGR